VCYLKDSELIAIGTDIGHIFFYDLNRSEYLQITYEEKYRHKGVVTDIISFLKKEKDEKNEIESMLSCSTDGLIFFWEVNKMEIKEIKRKNQFNYDESDEFILKGMKNKDKNSQKNEDTEKDLNKFLQTQKRKELKIYKCTPSIKKCINALKLTKEELKFNALAFQAGKHHTIIFSGNNNNKEINLWDYDKEKHIEKIENGSNSFITCMIVDYKKNYLLSTGNDGAIDIWDLATKPGDKTINMKLIRTIKDPDITNNYKPRINDLILLPRTNIMVICNNNKKIYFYDMGRNVITHTIKRENEITCLSCLESYGKLLCGTKQKMIIEINLNDELAKAGYRQVFDKYPFTKNKANYEESELDKYVNNFKIVKSLTQDDEIYDI
jgi:WD40 repeat protein